MAVTTTIVDRGMETDISSMIQTLLCEEGYSAEEAIAGLASAIVDFSILTAKPSTALDEAVDIMYEEEAIYDDDSDDDG